MSKASPPAQGILIIISAPSGCGKTTAVDRLVKRHPDWIRSISVTTRKPRSGEKDAEEYFFVSALEFDARRSKGDFLEYAKVFDQQYGTPKTFVLKQLGEGKNVILAIDIQGAKKVMRLLENKVAVASIFILPPSMKILRERLEGRRTDSPGEIERRIAIAQEEIKAANLYGFSVMNQQLEQTVLDIETYIERFQNERRENSHAVHTP